MFYSSEIVDVETGKTLGTEQSGELWIRGPQVASGYRNLPEQTKELFLPDGWVKTGSTKLLYQSLQRSQVYSSVGEWLAHDQEVGVPI